MKIIVKKLKKNLWACRTFCKNYKIGKKDILHLNKQKIVNNKCY